MTLEQTLVDELRIVGEVQAPPPPSAASLVRMAEHERARSRRTRLGGAVLVAAAVVAAVLIGVQVGRPSAAPSPTHPTPSYYAPGVPYLLDHTLYVGHEAQPGQWYSVTSWGDYTVALAADQTATILHEGKPLVRIGRLVDVIELSFDGTKAAWIRSDGATHGVLVVRDLQRGVELGRQRLVVGTDNAGFGVSLTVRNDGTAYYDVNGEQFRWTPGSRPVHTDQMPSSIPDQQAGFDGVPGVRLSPDHLWGAWITDARGRTPGDFSKVPLVVNVQKPGDPESRFTMSVPQGFDAVPITFWMSPTEISIQVPPSEIRCDIVERRCHAPG